MPKRNVLIFDKEESRWVSFLKEFFEDTLTEPMVLTKSSNACFAVDQMLPEMVFANPEFMSQALTQKLKVANQSLSHFRLFFLGDAPPNGKDLPHEAVFKEPDSLSAFQKQFVNHLVFPEKLRVLVIDDEPEIGGMIRDFLENRVTPSFQVEHTDDGNKGLVLAQENKYDVMVLDIKMPALDGRDVYRLVKERGLNLPVIVFFDAVSGEEMMDIRKIGRPAVVEKGGGESAMPEMMALIKKMVYFA